MSNEIKKIYNNEKVIDTINVDVVEQLARSVVDTTISKVVFKEKDSNIPNEWKEAIKTIKDNNNLERLLKSDVRQKSKYGKSYVGFDWFENKPIIWIANHNYRNTALRLNGMDEFAVRVVREYSAIANSTPILKNEVVYTNTTYNYLFLGGFGLGEIKSSNQQESRELYYKVKKEKLNITFPFDYVSLSTPKYILEQNKQGMFRHNLDVLPVNEMLNKDVADYYENDEYLSDWYPAQEYIPLLNELIKYIAWELNLDHTRVIGMFSMADLNNISNDSSLVSRSKDPKAQLQALIKQYSERSLSELSNNSFISGEDKAIKKKLLIRTPSSEGSVSVMNSKFDGPKHFDSIKQLISLIYKICGYSWIVDSDSSNYENVSQTQNNTRSVYETTKEKNELFTRKWKKMFAKMFYVILKKEGKFRRIEDVEREMEDYLEFKIISNVLEQQNNDWRRIMELKNSSLVSNERAIKLIWPELNEQEVQEEVNRLNQQEKDKMFDKFNKFGDDKDKGENFNAFNNQKPFGSKPFNKEE